ncbi:MAG: BlaI/MecI/CopY family transcriptional regulator [Bryobacterales bacterium]|nr:BlaI/MecI/CopY family transcriptional regulator [Bryobacterales bacterium]
MAAKPKPTAAELAILQILWQRGPSTVRDIHNDWDKDSPVGYTTVLKLLQIMTDKGLVERDETARAHVYKATSDREQTQGHLVRDLVDRVFGGSAAQLVLRALSERKTSAREIAEIRDMLDTFEKGKRK